MLNGEQVERHLRYQIIGLLHVGRLKPGVPLPSIRSVAKTLGVDHRLVAAAYRSLETEGLVEVRPAAGVFLADGEKTPGGKMEGWLGDVLLEGWNRGVSRGGLARLVARIAGCAVRCACVESNEDHMVAVAAELENDFSLQVERLMLGPSANAPVPGGSLDRVDLVVTTVFHAATVREAAGHAGIPWVLVRVDPRFAARIARVMHAGPATGVIVDPRFATRAQAYLDVTSHKGQVRFVTVDELDGGVDLRSPQMLITRAARRRLGLEDYHLVPAPPGYIAPESAAELCNTIASIGLAAAAAS